MTRLQNPFDPLQCDAGRRADLGGRWRAPCPWQFREGDTIHTLGWEGAEAMGGPMRFCSAHYSVLVELGLAPAEPVDEDDFRRRMRGEP